jgi:hypothetical protein
MLSQSSVWNRLFCLLAALLFLASDAILGPAHAHMLSSEENLFLEHEMGTDEWSSLIDAEAPSVPNSASLWQLDEDSAPPPIISMLDQLSYDQAPPPMVLPLDEFANDQPPLPIISPLDEFTFGPTPPPSIPPLDEFAYDPAPPSIIPPLNELVHDPTTASLFPDISLPTEVGDVGDVGEWFAYSDLDADCLSHYDGESVNNLGRRNDASCPAGFVPDVPAPAPFTNDHRQPPPIYFPPPGSHPGRMRPGEPEHDPRPRPVTHRQNTDFDFKFCPSGTNGYRLYAVCDSGNPDDRVLVLRMDYTLFHATFCKLCRVPFPPLSARETITGAMS